MKKKPTLFVFCGLPATGKTILSKMLAKKINAVYFRIDTIEHQMFKAGYKDIADQGYKIAYHLSTENLKLGNDVIADSCNPISLTRNCWEKAATIAGAKFINIEIICSNKAEHRKRVAKRKCDINGFKLPSWIEVENLEYHDWEKDRIMIDTFNKSIDESFQELINRIKQCKA